jgi:hypothetical protein
MIKQQNPFPHELIKKTEVVSRALKCKKFERGMASIKWGQITALEDLCRLDTNKTNSS